METQPLRYLFVAGLGRREIGPRDALRAKVKQVLAQLQAAVPDAQPVALSSAAAGADQVFLEAARELGWPLRLLLPVPTYLFTADFTTKDAAGATVPDTVAAAAFAALAQAAIDVEVMAAAPGRAAAFARTADELVRRADVVVALWNGQPGGLGGTNETLHFTQADASKKPVVLLDALTGAARPELAPPSPEAVAAAVALRQNHGILRDVNEAIANAPLVDGHTALARIQAARPGQAAPESNLARPPVTMSEVLEEMLKHGARTRSDHHRRRNTFVLWLHVAATMTGLVGLVFFGHAAAEPPELQPLLSAASGVAALKLLVVAAAFSLIVRVHRERQHAKWSRARYVREIGRSLTRTAPVTAFLGETTGAFVPPSLWAVFRRARMPLTTYYAQVRSASPRPTLEQAIAAYREGAFGPPGEGKGRLSVQSFYFEDTARHARHRLHWLHLAVWTCLALMVVSALAAFALPLFVDAPLWVKVAKFSSVFSPVLAAALLVLPNLNDWNRRATVYDSIAQQLAALDQELAALSSLLAEPGNSARQGAAGIPLWNDAALARLKRPTDAERAAVEAMVANRFAAIVAEAERAILTELVGFKTFVESVELA